jgi:hypothetical protein
LGTIIILCWTVPVFIYYIDYVECAGPE